ncbi:prephenate dehydrogenase/arogenate dehydrogenase family protein [Egbenema bharatensis]|uniref:prephenate dehydrogenase/arogenate dehydrogenase family protein n=1 Tax=Egbenema bharatensis TaxID=3463334 RepID=UPI003A88073B
MTVPKTLQQLDRDLIQLLRERNALLQATEAPPSLDQQLNEVRPLLANANVSELAWKTLLVNCMATLAKSPSVSSQTATDRRRITVVGGRGAMGRFFVDRLTAAGHAVSILEYDGWEQADTLLGQADLVLIAVPLKATVAVIRRIAPYLSSGTILADIASTKTEIMQTMMECHAGPVVGLHPMFGRVEPRCWVRRWWFALDAISGNVNGCWI